MASVGERVEEVRERRPFVDHLVRMVQHYGTSQGNLHAGAVTYFAFLSFFPLLAIAFFAVGYVSRVYPDADDQLRMGIDSLLPGLIGNGDGQVSLDDVRSFSGLAGVIGLVGVLYTGLGFIQVLREALTLTFGRSLPTASFVAVKLRDLLGLVTIGGTFLVSVAVGSGVTRFSDYLLDLVGLGAELSPLLAVLAVVVSVAINTLVFYVMFSRLATSRLPVRAMWSGALLGGLGMEVLKQASTALIALTKGNPAFTAFGVALVLIVVFNYFSRLALFAACWAYTAPDARAARGDGGPDPVQGPGLPSMRELARHHRAEAEAGRRAWARPFAAGGAAALGAVALVRRRRGRRS